MVLPDKASNNIITQSNRLTQARYTLTVAEQRLVLTILSFISPDDKDFKDYTIKVNSLANLLNIKNIGSNQRLSETIEKLAKRSIKIENEDGWLITNWFSSAQFVSSEGLIRFSVDPKLKPHLLQLKEQFTKMNLSTVAQFKSSYTIRIYMLLKQYQKIGQRIFSVDDLRETIGVPSGAYSQFKDFNRRVIQKAKSDFEEKKDGSFVSDISFDLETIRTGMKITHVKFHILNQKNTLIIESDNNDEGDNDIIPELVDLGINVDKAKGWLLKYGIDYLESKISLTKHNISKGSIKGSASGFLVAAVEKNYNTDALDKEKEEQLKIKEREREEKESLYNMYIECWLDNTNIFIKNENIDLYIDSIDKDELDKIKSQVRGDLQQVNMYQGDDSPAFLGSLRLALSKQVGEPSRDSIEENRKRSPAPTINDLQRKFDHSTAEKIEPFLEEFKGR